MLISTMNPGLMTDGYKTGHLPQYPDGTESVYSNWTARSNKHAPKGITHHVQFGPQAMTIWLHEVWENNFFNKPKDEVVGEIERELSLYLGKPYDASHFAALHDLGYLPIKVKALPEGTLVPMRVASVTIVNTKPEFFWITNFFETILSNMLWQPMTSASIAFHYYQIMKERVMKTAPEMLDAILFQAHDFSMRGMGTLMSTIFSGMGHAAVFNGSDSVPVIHGMRKYYGAKGFVIGSIDATEHSVMCAGTKDDELGTFTRLMDIVVPVGPLSIVSDTWNLWDVVDPNGGFLTKLYDKIMARDGKVVIRPDSGCPVRILCGYNTEKDWKLVVKPYVDAATGNLMCVVENEKSGDKKTIRYAEYIGVVECLAKIFTTTKSSTGFTLLNEKIGSIYGDSITTVRATQIFDRLEEKGFASINAFLGIGSYTYQYNTRDTFGYAMKATSVVVNGVRRDIFKDPITDDGTKKSARGLLAVFKDANGEYFMIDECTPEMEATGELQIIYEDGIFFNQIELDDIRKNLRSLA